RIDRQRAAEREPEGARAAGGEVDQHRRRFGRQAHAPLRCPHRRAIDVRGERVLDHVVAQGRTNRAAVTQGLDTGTDNVYAPCHGVDRDGADGGRILRGRGGGGDGDDAGIERAKILIGRGNRQRAPALIDDRVREVGVGVFVDDVDADRGTFTGEAAEQGGAVE